MTSNAREKREIFSRHGAISLSAPIRRKWYRKARQTVFHKNVTNENYSDLGMHTFSNQLMRAVDTWHSFHASLMKLGLSTDSISSEKMVKESLKFSNSPSSSSSTDSFIDYNNDDSVTESEYSDDDLDVEELFNLHPHLSIPNLELQTLLMKEMFPGLSQHWRIWSTEVVKFH